MTDAWRLWEMSDLSTPWALRVAVTLRVPDLLADGVVDGAELASRTGADRGALERLIRHLAARGVFTEPEPGRFGLTEAGRCLRAGDPSRMHEWLDLHGAGGRMDQVYALLLEAVRTGEPAYAEAHGKPFWADLESDPELQRSFDQLMSQDSVDYHPMVEGRDWSAVGQVVDVGGGQGELLAQVLRANPHLRGTLFDLPGTVAGAPSLLSAAGVADRCTVVGGSFFDDAIPGGADLYLIASVLHNWSDRDALAILRRTAGAAGPGGRVLVLEGLVDENTVDEDTDRAWATHLDLKMLILLGGRERSSADFTALAQQAGLTPVGEERQPRGPFSLQYAVLEYAVDTAPPGT